MESQKKKKSLLRGGRNCHSPQASGEQKGFFHSLLRTLGLGACQERKRLL